MFGDCGYDVILCIGLLIILVIVQIIMLYVVMYYLTPSMQEKAMYDAFYNTSKSVFGDTKSANDWLGAWLGEYVIEWRNKERAEHSSLPFASKVKTKSPMRAVGANNINNIMHASPNMRPRKVGMEKMNEFRNNTDNNIMRYTYQTNDINNIIP